MVILFISGDLSKRKSSEHPLFVLVVRMTSVHLGIFSLLPPLFVPHPSFLVSEPGDVHHEDPRQPVHNYASQLHHHSGPRRGQLAVEHGGAHAHPHGGEKEDEEQVDGVAQQAVVAPHPAQEPAGLQQRVGELAAEDDGARLARRHARQQRQQDAGNAGGVMAQHDGAIAAEAYAPGHVEQEVAQADAQRGRLQSRVLTAWE